MFISDIFEKLKANPGIAILAALGLLFILKAIFGLGFSGDLNFSF